MSHNQALEKYEDIKSKLSLMTSETVHPNIHAFTSTLRGKYSKIHTYGALIPTEGSTVMTTAIVDHNSLRQ